LWHRIWNKICGNNESRLKILSLFKSLFYRRLVSTVVAHFLSLANVEWTVVIYEKWFDFDVKWSELRWSFGDKSTNYFGMTIWFIPVFKYSSSLFCIVVYMVYFVCFSLILELCIIIILCIFIIMCSFANVGIVILMYPFCVSCLTVLFCGLFVCKCVLYTVLLPPGCKLIEVKYVYNIHENIGPNLIDKSITAVFLSSIRNGLFSSWIYKTTIYIYIYIYTVLFF
jgi:hypothetical protein